MTPRSACCVILAVVLAAAVDARGAVAQSGPAAPDCTAPLRDPSTHVKVADHPFDVVSTADGCWIFVSTQRVLNTSGITVLRRGGGRVTEQRFVELAQVPAGIALTHDEKMLIVTAGTQAVFLDVDALTSGAKDPILGTITNPDFVGSIMAIVTADDHWAFISQERTASITVVDLAKVRAGPVDAHVIVGHIPSGGATVGLALSPDGKTLYSTSETAPPRFNYPTSCAPEQQAAMALPAAGGRAGRRGGPGGAPNHAEALLQVIDVPLATTQPASSVVGSVRAGCNAVRIALSPDGATAYVTARGDNALLVFDTKRLRTDPAHARIAVIGVGESPVGIAVIDSGRKIVVTNSGRFGPANGAQTLTVIDAMRVSEGKTAVLGTMPAGAFPRQLSLSADGRTLLLTNFTSGTVEIIDVARLPMKKR